MIKENRIKVIKRNGDIVDFDKDKIYNAVSKAFVETYSGIAEYNIGTAHRVTDNVVLKIYNLYNNQISVEEIQNIVECELMDYDKAVAQAYIRYRYKREMVRGLHNTDNEMLSLIDCENEAIKEENSNKNPTLLPTQRDYMAGTVSKDLTNRILLPEDIVKAHNEGIIHFHDADYFAQHMHNCDLIDLNDMLQNGTVISGTMIEKPHSFATACTIATQIIAQVASNQYGGQSITLSALAPFVDISRQKIRKDVEYFFKSFNWEIKDGDLPTIDDIVEEKVQEEIKHGVQTIQYQIVTLMTTNGQSPFVTVFMYLNEAQDNQTKHDLALIIEEMLKQRYQGVKNEVGVWITPAFPKLIYVLEEDNIHENSPYYYLTKLAAKCTAKRLVPDYISEKVMKQLKDGHCFTSMGCRSFLSPWKDENGSYKFYGRFNKGVVTINLVDVALTAKKNNSNDIMTEFWKIFDERLELCHRALICRYERLKGTPSDVAPILWQYGALTRLKKGEVIDKYLTGGYSSISLGYAGLWECVYALTGYKLTEKTGRDIGKKIMQHMNDKCDDWNKDLNLGFSIYGTPLESTTYKFAKCLQKRFGIIKGVTDKNYITNSYHIHVTEPIDAFTKLSIESEFQSLSTGGAISYVEVPNLNNNIEAVLEVIKFIYDHIMYAELNTKSDYCQVCGFDGEIQIIEDKKTGKLVWECPNCHNRDEKKLNVARRTCGYIGSNFWNAGRTQEIKERVIHIGDN
jgi:anaerobic ribonucleoside-triphosphate reductase|nr:MAG TPA: anaerobic ribonucleoside triphosphate reductase [Caudoviricetes sp.]